LILTFETLSGPRVHVSACPEHVMRAEVTKPLLLAIGALTLSALLLGAYAGGGKAYLLGFVALVPWLLSLRATPSLFSSLLSAWALSVGFVWATFGWFGAAFGAYVGLDETSALVILLLLAPLLQPQIIAFVLVRQWVGRTHGALLVCLAGAAAWVGIEWVWPKLLGDTLGHGLYPSAALRQLADLGGSAGLSLILILCNEAIAQMLVRLRDGLHAALKPLLALGGILALALTYGHARLEFIKDAQAQPAASIRVGMVQANLTNYEAMRREMGAFAVVRQVLDTHFAMSAHAIREQGADALLWSETTYPTTFGQPKSEDGAGLDEEILQFVRDSGAPLLFGTYDSDAQGEYNSAALVDPERGLLGHYRKTHPFPLTEYVPAWLDGPALRRLLPWVGSWRAGNGARVLPLRTADGREVDVLPLICLDDVRSQLAIDGARLGAQAILGMSNDSWFTTHPEGARLHLTVAAFRSIETRLPQLRVTTNGLSAIIDETGEVVASTLMSQQAVLVGEIPVRAAIASPLVRTGDWVGLASVLGLLALALRHLALRLKSGFEARSRSPVGDDQSAFAAEVTLLAPRERAVAVLLRLLAGAGLIWLGISMLLGEGLQVSSLAQLTQFAFSVALPLLASWALMRFRAAHAWIADGDLHLQRANETISIPLASIDQLRAWRLPLLLAGVDLWLRSGRRFELGLATRDAQRLLHALQAAGSPAHWAGEASARYLERAAAARPWLDHAVVKFALFPLLPALIAFHLHQTIAFGGPFGELYTFGLRAWLTGLAIWWASWSLGLMLFAAGLRIVAELIALVILRLVKARTQLRQRLEDALRVIYYLGVPSWLLLRIFAT